MPGSHRITGAYDQNGQPIFKEAIQAYLTQFGEDDRRLEIIARDVRITLKGARLWWALGGGKVWARARRLPEPWFVSEGESTWGHPFASTLHRRRKRIAQIDRFRRTQRQKGHWFSVASITEWLARENGNIEPSPAKREIAYRRFATSLLDGEFDRDRSQVLCLHPDGPPIRLDANLLAGSIDLYGADYSEASVVVSGYLSHCWIPRDLYEQWCMLHGLRLHPQFDLTRSATSSPNGSTARPTEPPGPKPGRRPPLKTIVPEMAVQILADGLVLPGRGRRAALVRLINDKLAAKGQAYDDSSVRKALGDVISQWERTNPGQ
jgi:hypothetical protein